MEPSIPFQTLVKLVDAGGNTNEKVRTLDITLEISKVTSKLASQIFLSEIYDSITEVLFTQTKYPINKSKLHFRNYCIYCHKYSHSHSNCFRKQRKDEERKRNSPTLSKSPVNFLFNALNLSKIKFIQMNSPPFTL